MSRKKGFTLVELLVVIGIIALLVSILMPALGRARELAKRIQCAANLNGIGKAIALYQNEYDDQNPRAWRGQNPAWGFGGNGSDTGYNTGDSIAKARFAIPNFQFSSDGVQTVGACLYLLVKYEDVDPKMFVCPSSGDGPMNFEDAVRTGFQVEGWEDLNDFQSDENLSYSYNDPWNRILDSSASASLVLMADKSPAYDYSDPGSNNGFLPDPACDVGPNTGSNFNVGTPEFNGSWDDEPLPNSDQPNPQHGNSNNHGTEVQEVLYADTHVTKEDTPLAGMQEDNIYTFQVGNQGFPTDNSDDFRWLMIGGWGNTGSGPGSMYVQNFLTDRDTYLGN